MHFSKWMRKNSKKIMVFVVIFSMLSFVIGYTGLQIFFSFFGSQNPVIGIYEGNQKVRGQDFQNAQNELRLLQMLGADRILMAQGQQGLNGPLMAHMLFPESPFAADLPTELKQAAQRGQLQVDIDKIEAFFSEPVQPPVVWILLKAEAQKAGCIASDETARNALQNIIPQLAQGADPAKVLASMVNETHIPENRIVRVFADLLSVMIYTSNILDNQAVTLNQLQASIGRSREKFDAEFVKIPAEWFIDPNTPVDAADLVKQFETYKSILPGTVTDDNPYGFGYKLPKRVQLEYMAVLLDDVKTQIKQPTAEEMEEYYSRNIQQFQEETPVDPNNPDGEKVTNTHTYAESLPQIRARMEQDRITRLATLIFNDARSATEKGLGTINFEQAEAAQLQQAAGDYVQTAAELTAQHKINVVTGKTGLLGPVEFGEDKILQGLRLQQGQRTAALSEVVYAVGVDAEKARRQIGVPTVRLWENIGPMTGGYYDEQAGKYHRLMAMVRVVEVKDATVPDTMDITYSVRQMAVTPQQKAEPESTFSLTKLVTADVRTLQAMEKAKSHAESLAALVKEYGWEEGVSAFNEKFALNNRMPGVSVETVRQQARMSQAEIARTRLYMQANPISAQFIRNRLQTNALNEKIYALLPDNEATTGTVFAPLTAEQSETCYVVKSVTRIPASEKDYLDNKAMTAFQLNNTAAAESALIQLQPKHLLERMHYEIKETSTAQAPQLPLPDDGGY